MNPNSSAPPRFDVAIIGAGIAGASLARELARTRSVLLIERESQPGYHTTGRSAALFSETYGNATIRSLTRASRGFLLDPPPGFASAPLLTPRGVLVVGRPEQMERVRDEARQAAALSRTVREVDATFVRERVPMLRTGAIAGAVFEPDAMDIDVHALHQGCLRDARAAGATLVTDAAIERLDASAGGWTIASRDAQWRAEVVVDAAGAWADDLARLAGARPLGLTPLRRTAIRVDAPHGARIADWPAVIDIEEQFYFKPDAGKLLLSPADETPSAPCDAQPDELDIAIGVDRVQAVAELEVRRVHRAWAGLRTFAPDRTPVLGFDPVVPRFFWLAGQGGYGIQTAPAMAALAAAAILARDDGAAFERIGVTPQALSPARFAAPRVSPA